MFVALKNKNLLRLFLATLLMFVSFSVLMPTLPVFLRERGATHFLVGLVVGAFPVGVLLFRAIAGWLVSEIGRRKSLLASAALALAIPVAYHLFQSHWLLVVVRVVHGGLLSIFTTATLVMVADVVRPERRGAAISEMGIANYLGLAFGPALAEAVYAPANLSGVLVLMGVSTFFAVVTMRRLREVPPQVDDTLIHDGGRVGWFTPGVLLASLVFFLGAVGHGAAFTFVPLLVKEYGLGPSGPYYMVFAAFTLLVRTFGRNVPDRYGRVTTSWVALLLFTATLVGLGMAQNQVWVLAAGALHGLVFGIFQPALTALVADMTTYRTRGPVFGLFLGAFDGGFIVAGLGLGYVADLLGLRIMLSLGATAPLLGVMVLLALRRAGSVTLTEGSLGSRHRGTKGMDTLHLVGESA